MESIAIFASQTLHNRTSPKKSRRSSTSGRLRRDVSTLDKRERQREREREREGGREREMSVCVVCVNSGQALRVVMARYKKKNRRGISTLAVVVAGVWADLLLSVSLQ